MRPEPSYTISGVVAGLLGDNVISMSAVKITECLEPGGWRDNIIQLK